MIKELLMVVCIPLKREEAICRPLFIAGCSEDFTDLPGCILFVYGLIMSSLAGPPFIRIPFAGYTSDGAGVVEPLFAEFCCATGDCNPSAA